MENTCTEYKVECAPEAWIYTIPSFGYYFNDPDVAYRGRRYVGVIAGHARKNYYRSFVRSRLLCGLRKGNKYRLSFAVKSVHPVLDSIGIYFTAYDFIFEKTPHHKITPAMYLQDAVAPPVNTDSNWQQVTLEYIATGNENYVAIGNFSKRNITGETGLKLESNFFVLLDEVSFSPLNPNEKICEGWKTVEEEIMNQDERHEFLIRRIQFYRKREPPVVDNAMPTILQQIDTLIIPDILFATGSAKPHEAFYPLLDSFCSKIMATEVDSMIIQGHTDSKGDRVFNYRLSDDRAFTVKDYVLASTVLNPLQVITRGFGSDSPVAENETPAGRQKNRRVEIFLYLRQ